MKRYDPLGKTGPPVPSVMLVSELDTASAIG
jgi:hypothetical protein